MEITYSKNKVNRFKNYSKIPLNFFNIMLLHNESIWKLLKYDNIEIIDHDDDDIEYYGEMDIDSPNLTRDEKLNLLYKGGNNSDDYRVFLQRTTDDAEKESNIKLKIYSNSAYPKRNDSQVILNTINFEIVVHNKYNPVDGGKRSRVDCICEELMNLFLGIQMDGIIGDVFFDYDQSRNQDKISENLSNVKNYFGKILSMSFFTSTLEDKSNRC